MKDALVFTANIDIDKSDKFIGLAYAAGMIGCEESESNNTITYTCYFETEEAISKAKDILAPLARTTTDTEIIKDRDWNSKWRETIEPVQITETIWVSPEWLTPPLKDNQQWIKIEPRMAFGTGHHETTRLASQAIFETKGETLLDVGTGSGILAFVADIAGYKSVTGIEVDPDCEINLNENLEANRGNADIEFIIGSIDSTPNDKIYDTVIMNIIRTHSEPLLAGAKSHLKNNGTLIWSGILVEEREIVISFAKKGGFTLFKETSDNEWWCGYFKQG
jgi:ribosomal protein L11 methyltransferase